MKIIHTADWHLGQSFFGYDRTAEHQAFLDWLTEQIRKHQADALLICGDVFDAANPSARTQRRFYRFLQTITESQPHLQVVIIAGNHDSAARLEAPIPLLENRRTYIRGSVLRRENGEIDAEHLILPLFDKQGNCAAWCMAVPYLRQGDYPQSAANEGDPYRNGVKTLYHTLLETINRHRSPQQAVIAMGHLQTIGCTLSEDDPSERLIIGGLEGLPTDIFDPGITYTALGHIHRGQRADRHKEVYYAGSPIPMSFAEENYRHGVRLLEIESGRLVNQEKLVFTPLCNLLRIPHQPRPLAAVLQQLAALPASLPDTPAPYLEVRVLLTEPEPALRNRIEEIVSHKHVRLTRVLPFYPTSPATATETPFVSTEQLLDPWQMVQRVYEKQYQSALPEELALLFQEILEEAYQKQQDRA